MKKPWLILIVVVVVIAGVAAYFYNRHLQNKTPEGVLTSNGRLQMQRVDVGGLYAGKVSEVLVQEGDIVKKDQDLVRLQSDQYKNQENGANAQLQAAKENVSQADAQIKAETEQLNIAQLELKDARALYRDHLISASELKHRQMAVAARQAALQAAKAQKQQAHASVDGAQAQLDAATSSTNDLLIKAPIAGRVEYRYAEPGNVVAAGHPVVSLLNPANVKMAIYLATENSAKLQYGQEARIQLDGIDAVWPAHVSFISGRAQFTPKYVETSNERKKMMYRVEVKIPAETALKYSQLLKSGMTGEVWLKTTAQDWPADLAIKLP
ncbi:HlyD family secretion protein [Brackiella oedipodis]|uniref:HlyD family secretion protein n=1 Tax=Brackiella oedipodis TaxID=124225 RepID=UPI00048C07FE|nr:HlyD family efflux transporter periplasmic adaptor subunit [Brackiella oedipodis]